LARFEKIAGTVSTVEPSRIFVDGVYYLRLEFTESNGRTRELEKVFFTNKIALALKPKAAGEFYFWNSHCYAIRSGSQVVEDIEGARASYLKRDARLLFLMSLSIVLLPVSLFVVAKKLIRAGSRKHMESYFSAG
jgi:hypothetical protein